MVLAIVEPVEKRDGVILYELPITMVTAMVSPERDLAPVLFLLLYLSGNMQDGTSNYLPARCTQSIHCFTLFIRDGPHRIPANSRDYRYYHDSENYTGS